MRAISRRSTWLGATLRLGGSALVLALLFHFLPLNLLWPALRRLSPGLWLLVLGCYLGAHIAGVIKWRLMVNLGGAKLSFRQATQCYCGGLFGTLFLPSLIGGDLIRMGLALRAAHNRAGALLGAVADRFLDIAALGTVATLGAVLLPTALDAQTRARFWKVTSVVGVVLSILLATGIAVLASMPVRRFSYRMRRRFVRLRQAAQAMSRQPLSVLFALALGITVQTIFVLLTAMIAAGCGLHLPLRVWLFAWPLAKLSALLPITQGGSGVREVALAALVAPLGGPPVLTVAVGLVWEAIILAGGLLAGLIGYLLRRAVAAPASQSEASFP